MKHLKLLIATVVAMFGMQAFAQNSWTSSQLSEGKYLFLNVGSGRYLGPGNSWGTQASLIANSQYVTLHGTDGAYTIESQVTNGGTKYFMGFDNGLFMDQGTAATINIKDNGQGVYTLETNGTYLGYDGTSTVLNYNLDDPNSDNAQWVILPLEDALNGAATHPKDATYLIIDANFDRNNRSMTGKANNWQGVWTINASNHNIAGNNTNYCMESWQSAFEVYQTIDVPNGKYEVTAQAAMTEYNVTGSNLPYVFANDQKATFPAMVNGENSLGTMSQQFSAGNYKVGPLQVIVTDGKLTVGVRGTRTDTWCVWDNFTLKYFGPVTDLSVYKELLQAAVTKAQALENKIPSAAYRYLNLIVTENNKDYTTVAEYTTAIQAINDAVADAETLQAPYAHFSYIREKVLAVNPNLNLTSIGKAMENTVKTTSDISSVLRSMRNLLLKSLQDLTIPEGGLDLTDALIDNPTVSENIDYWTAEEIPGIARTGGSFGVTNYGETEFYNNNFDFYQNLTLTRGTWEFGVTGFHRAGNHNTYFYAGNDKILIPGVESSVVNTMAQAQTYFNNGNGKVALNFGLENETETLKIGIINNDTETDKWTIFRNFTLKYYGPTVDYSVYAQRWQDALAAAETAKRENANVKGSELEAVNAAIQDAPDGSSKANYIEKIDALNAAVNALVAAAPYYNAYYEELERGAAAQDPTGVQPQDPTSAGNALELRGQYVNDIFELYPYNVTEETGAAFSAENWTMSENATFNQGTEHWADDGQGYWEQSGAEWSAQSWSLSMNKVFNLKPGEYLLKVAARASGDVVATITCGDVVVKLPAKNANGYGINLEGDAAFTPQDVIGYAHDGLGYGWEWRYLPINLDVEGEVQVTINAATEKQYNWVSLANAEMWAAQPWITEISLDENERTEFQPAETANVTVNRVLKADRWNTLVLPFNFTLPEGWEAYELSDASESERYTETIELELEPTDALEAGMPYFVKPDADVATIEAQGVELVTDLSPVKVFENKVEFTPFYQASILPEGSIYLANNKFYTVDTHNGLESKGFRAYFKVSEELAGAKFTFTAGGKEVTGIEGVVVEKLNNGALYNLNGQRVNKAQKGVYIVNGKKVVLK